MIGVFDSGVGGLTVVKEIFKQLPEYQIIYFGDTARLPYGTKGADFVQRYSVKITDWLLRRGAKIIVVACNTSSAWASDLLKKRFPKTPIFEMITPAVDEIVRSNFKKIGIIGTPGTIKSAAYQKKILKQNPSLKILSQPCPLFVPMVEMGFTKGKVTEEIVKEYLKKIKLDKTDALILACTHYPLLEKTIEKVMGTNVEIVNPAKVAAKEIKTFLQNNPGIEKQIKKGSGHKFFFSDEPYDLEKISHLCFSKKIKPIVNDPFDERC